MSENKITYKPPSKPAAPNTPGNPQPVPQAQKAQNAAFGMGVHAAGMMAGQSMAPFREVLDSQQEEFSDDSGEQDEDEGQGEGSLSGKGKSHSKDKDLEIEASRHSSFNHQGNSSGHSRNFSSEKSVQIASVGGVNPGFGGRINAQGAAQAASGRAPQSSSPQQIQAEKVLAELEKMTPTQVTQKISPFVLNALVSNIYVVSDGSHKTVRIQFKHDALDGELNAELTRTEEGTLEILFSGPAASTIERNANELRSALKRKGLKASLRFS